MNSKKLFALAGLVALSLASTVAHADIKKKPGWHYVKIVNNLYNTPSIGIKIKNRGGGKFSKCYDIKPWQTITDNTFLVKTGDVLEYNGYLKNGCINPGKVYNPKINTIVSNKDEYWYVWF